MLAVRAVAQEPVTRQQALDTAAAYQLFEWTPTARNAFHGRDADGIQVDTPDQGFQRPGTRPGWWAPGQRNGRCRVDACSATAGF